MTVPDAAAPGTEHEHDPSLTSVVLEHHPRVRRHRPAADGRRDAAYDVAAVGSGVTPGFRNEPDTDPALAANREWGRRILARVPGSTLGMRPSPRPASTTPRRSSASSRPWPRRGRAWGAAARRRARRRAAPRRRTRSAANRDRLIEVMAAETGKTIAEADPEVSEADRLRALLRRARARARPRAGRRLRAVEAHRRHPAVELPRRDPRRRRARRARRRLAASSSSPRRLAQRSRRRHGRGALGGRRPARAARARRPRRGASSASELVSHPAVDRVILTGAYETAQLFRSWRHDLPLLAETSGKNAIIVTPSRRPRPRGSRRREERLRPRRPEVLGRDRS